MKIYAFCGSHSTGKSTLLEHFKGKEDVVCYDSVTRGNTTKEERRIDDVTDLSVAQSKIAASIICKMEDLIETYQNTDKIIFLDRCVIDYIAYTIAFYYRGLISEELGNSLIWSVRKYVDYIDKIFYLPLEFDIVDDGSRSTDEELRKEVDRNIQNLLSGWDKVVVVEGSVEDRIKTIEEWI